MDVATAERCLPGEEGRLIMPGGAFTATGTRRLPGARAAMFTVLRDHMAPNTQAQWDELRG